MGHDPGDFGPARSKRARDFDDFGAVRLETRAMAVAVDLDQYRQDAIAGSDSGGDCLCGLEAVEHDRKMHAARHQRQRAGELGGRESHAVEDVAVSVGREFFRLLQGGHRDRAWNVALHEARDFEGFRGLHVQAQLRAERRNVRAHVCCVGFDLAALEQQGGGIEFGQGLQWVLLSKWFRVNLAISAACFSRATSQSQTSSRPSTGTPQSRAYPP